MFRLDRREIATKMKVMKVFVLILTLFTPFIIGQSTDGDHFIEDISSTEIEVLSTTSADNENDPLFSTELLIATSDDLDNSTTAQSFNDENETEPATEPDTEGETESETKSTNVDCKCKKEIVNKVVKSTSIKCKDGLLLSVWRPYENLTFGDRFARGFVYFLILCYLFLGVSIVSDRFMAAIEKITAIEKEVYVRKPDGSKQKIVVRVWNETVANLTLMALGTSAPEILLSIIEIFTMNFEAGDLGPGTIVGSAGNY